MEQQGNRLGYLVAGLVIVLLVILLGWFIVGQKKVVSPVPEEGIKVIFTSPSPSPTPSPTPEITPTPTPTPKAKASPKPTPSPTPSPSPSPSPTATP